MIRLVLTCVSRLSESSGKDHELLRFVRLTNFFAGAEGADDSGGSASGGVDWEPQRLSGGSRVRHFKISEAMA